ncbi:MAG: PspC domain-containing protein [Bacteroidetes bacterium]|nr:PspC domain-containing protein [Bacteroidota bacterium]
MNKTITMNLSGIIFHIEEDAYEMLNKYLSTIKGYFRDSEGRDEIMSDIESRIAEMLQEKVNQTKQAVLRMDVENVIAMMGKPEDFAGDNQHSDNNNEPYEKESRTAEGRRRRVFRDPDDKILGGVCSGIANYFNFDPLWLRAAFAVSFFVFGSGLLLYIILCIIIPKAKTTAEKLEMRGEKVDVNNIGKAVHDEFEDFKKNMKDFGNEVGSKENRDRIRTSTEKTADFLKDLFLNIAKVIGTIFSTILTIFAVIFMIILLGTAFGMNFIHISEMGQDHSYSIYDISDKLFPADMSIQYLIVGALLFFGIPLLGIIYAGIKLLFGIKNNNKIVKYTFNTLWLIGLGILIYVGMRTYQDCSVEATVKQKIELQQNDTLYLSVKNLESLVQLDEDGGSRYRVGNLNWSELDNSNDELFYEQPVRFDIEQSETDQFQLILSKYACGETKTAAQIRAKGITYGLSQTDSLIEFEPQFNTPKNDKWRGQEARLSLKMPLNKVVYLSKSMEHIIFNISNINQAIDYDMVNRRWIMTRQGLACIDCDNLQTVEVHDTVVPVHPSAPEAPPEVAPAPAPTSKKYFFSEPVTFK